MNTRIERPTCRLWYFYRDAKRTFHMLNCPYVFKLKIHPKFPLKLPALLCFIFLEVIHYSSLKSYLFGSLPRTTHQLKISGNKYHTTSISQLILKWLKEQNKNDDRWWYCTICSHNSTLRSISIIYSFASRDASLINTSILKKTQPRMQTKATTGLLVSCLKYNNLVTEETRPKITQRTTHVKWKFDVCPSKKWPIEFTTGQTMIQIQSIYFKL